MEWRTSMLQIRKNNLDNTINLESQINSDLQLITKYSAALNAWNLADDEYQLINAVSKLIKYNLDNQENFQFEMAKPSTYWMTLLFERIADQFNDENITLHYPDDHANPTLRFSGLANQEFFFTTSTKAIGGFDLRVATYDAPILFIDLHNKLFYLHADNLAKLFVKYVGSHQELAQQIDFESTIRQIANVFTHAGFDVDLNILNKDINVDNNNIPASTVDDLFMKISDENNKVKSEKNGISIHLKDQVVVNLEQSKKTENVWTFKINDISNQYSLLTILQQYKIFGNWYIHELSNVGVKYQQEFFQNN